MSKMQCFRFFFLASLLVSSLCAGAAERTGARSRGAAQSGSSSAPPVAVENRTVSPGTSQWVQLTKLGSSTCIPGGISVAIRGTAIAVGVPSAGCGAYSGTAALFLKPKLGWKSPGPGIQLLANQTWYGYGSAVAVGDRMAVVGDPDPSMFPGYAYVLLPGKRGWKRRTYAAAGLVASDGSCATGTCLPTLGSSLAVSGNTIVVGGPLDEPVMDDQGNFGTGAAFVFVKPPTGWANMTETAKLIASDGRAWDYLGSSVAISGNTVVVSGAGAEYVFDKPSKGWKNMTQTAKLTASDGTGLGSVAINGDTVFAAGGSAVYVFVKPTRGWKNMTQTAMLTASDGTGLGNVAISGNTVAATGGATVYTFVKPASGWADMTETDKMTDSDGVNLGPVSISGNTLVAGSPDNYVAYVFGQSQ